VRIASLIIVVVGLVLVAPGSAIEAVRGKNYTLTKDHGPWMVMVASFHNVPKERHTEGLTAEEAAIELVYELRSSGIPAYSYSQGAVVQKIDTIDRQGRDDTRVFAAQRDMVCVLAGNWKSIDDKEAQKALTAIKKYRPKFLKDQQNGAIFRETPGRKGPLGGAFMTINPMLSAEEVAQSKGDADLKRMNVCEYSLTQSKKKYSLQVATFTGKQSMQLGASQFDQKLQSQASYGLNRAGEDAMQLVRVLRSEGIEAYVYHDRYQSIVTIGSFNSPNEPQIIQLAKEYSPQFREDPEHPTQQKLLPYTKVIKTGGRTDFPMAWVFDVQPRLVRASDGRPEAVR